MDVAPRPFCQRADLRIHLCEFGRGGGEVSYDLVPLTLFPYLPIGCSRCAGSQFFEENSWLLI